MMEENNQAPPAWARRLPLRLPCAVESGFPEVFAGKARNREKLRPSLTIN
jgi:hypothetical protein